MSLNSFKHHTNIIMGKIFKFDKDVDTDQIIASQYLLYPTIDEMKVHTFESLDKDFAANVKPGDYVVASENFGCGSSREQAPSVLKALGVKAVIAKSFARIFYRNAINIGLPVIVCKDLHENVATGEDCELKLSEGVVEAGGKAYACTKLPAYMQGILDQGGLIASLNKEEAQASSNSGSEGSGDCAVTTDHADDVDCAVDANIADCGVAADAVDRADAVDCAVDANTADAKGGLNVNVSNGQPARPMTMAEKIIAAAAGVKDVKPGDIHTVELDRLMSNDGTTHLTIDMYNKLKNPQIADIDKLVWIVDHNVPCDSVKTANSHKKMRDFAKASKVKFYEGAGVCHQIMIENHVTAGELIFGADSHTCAYGALGAFGTGVGCTDYLYAMVTGHSWLLVPETLRFNLSGKLPKGVYARDLILTIIGQISANGANYKAMEFGGEGLKNLTISDRVAICNLCVEAGAKTAIMEVDNQTIDYLKEHGREPKQVFAPDADAAYAKVYDIDLSTVKPIVAKPHFVDSVVDAAECLGTHIDEAFLGSCNNGRIEDLRVGAEIIRGKKVNPLVRFLVVPASQAVYAQALEEGILKTFMDAGAIVMNPNCSVCWGSCQGVIGADEVLISTGTRNFKGRAGSPESFVYLASAATVTASAIKGEITTEDKL